MEPIDTPAALGRELKRWTRNGTGRPTKVPALARRLNISQSSQAPVGNGNNRAASALFGRN